MTTRVTIKNEDDSQHDVVVTFLGSKFAIPPGSTYTTHVWKGSDLVVEEGKPVVQETKVD